MSITNRLSLFFLIATALVLAGFSLTLYVLASGHLHRQENHRLDAAMQVLVAAIEVHPGDVEWEPLERRVTLGEEPGLDQVRWTVHDLHGRLVDCSANLEGDAALQRRDIGWRMRVRRVRAGKFEAEPVEGRAEFVPGTLREGLGGEQAPGDVVLPKDRTFHGDGVVLTVAASEEPVRSTLQLLALTMLGVSSVVWLTAAVWGRWLCQRALRPIVTMAASARSIRRRLEDGSFLAVPPTSDEIEDLGRALNDLLAALRESLARQQRFTGDASHQLRTPLTAMLGKVDVALRKERTPAEYQQVLCVLRRRGEQLQQIVESLLFLARAETAASLPDTEVLDLNDWSHSWLEKWRDHPRAADIGIQDRLGTAWVRAPPALLGQVLDNLVDNACKYSEAGTPISVSVESEGGESVLTVVDRGCGIEPEELPLVTQPFYRSPHARWLGKPGLGLGLAVVVRLLSMMGGKLGVSSQPGQGSRFRVTLPSLGLADVANRSPGATEDGLDAQHRSVG
ncbi:MAG: HAMP domain-containing histidine kinase [Gemmataceae bacterium]|nr:HAMP domain-containing histidine kinase [Gemmataceae bacterium]